MDSIASISNTLAGGALSTASGGSGKIHQAVQQFEALLIGQLLKTSREAGGSGWLGTDEGDSGETGVEFGEEQLAQTLASSGGLRLSQLIESGLSREQAKVSGK